MEIKKLDNNWYQITKRNWLIKLLGIIRKGKKYKHLIDKNFTSAEGRGVYMCENGKILNPFYDNNVTIIDNFRRLQNNIK